MSDGAAWIAAVDLPQRWRGRHRFVVLDVGIAEGRSLLALHRLWRDDAARCAQLHVVVIDDDISPPSMSDGDAADPFADELVSAWPLRTPDLHRLSFDGGAFVVLLVPMRLERALSDLVAEVDFFHLSGAREDASLLDRRAMKGVARLAAAGALVRIDAPTSAMRDGLVTAGFRFDAPAPIDGQARAAGSASQPIDAPEVAAAAELAPLDRCGRFEPRVPPRDPRRSHRADAAKPHRAIVIGAGLAGCATAWALAECGWHSTIIDTHATLAAEASGNAAGLFHGIFNRHDGQHARLYRAAALEATTAVRHAIESHHVRGAIDGVLRLDSHDADAREMQTAIDALALPAAYVEALDAARMGEAAGIAVPGAGWLYRGGGWVDPAGLARSFVERAGERVTVQHGVHVTRLRRLADGWQLLDAHGSVIDRGHAVVLANAHDAVRLIDGIGYTDRVGRIDVVGGPEGVGRIEPRDEPEPRRTGSNAWPLTRVRGQVSMMPRRAWPHGSPPRRPLTGSGYVVAIDGDRVMFGATSDADDQDPAVRDADHVANLERLGTWVADTTAIETWLLQGRTAWRCVAEDRLPVIGAVPLPAQSLAHRAGRTRLDQPRFVPREQGLYVFTALGSRGITWAALGAETLASIITGAPCPIDASLLDAVDPARFTSRCARHGG